MEVGLFGEVIIKLLLIGSFVIVVAFLLYKFTSHKKDSNNENVSGQPQSGCGCLTVYLFVGIVIVLPTLYRLWSPRFGIELNSLFIAILLILVLGAFWAAKQDKK